MYLRKRLPETKTFYAMDAKKYKKKERPPKPQKKTQSVQQDPEKLWEVERIDRIKGTGQQQWNERFIFNVKWANYSTAENTWQKITDFRNVIFLNDLLVEFKESKRSDDKGYKRKQKEMAQIAMNSLKEMFPEKFNNDTHQMEGNPLENRENLEEKTQITDKPDPTPQRKNKISATSALRQTGNNLSWMESQNIFKSMSKKQISTTHPKEAMVLTSPKDSSLSDCNAKQLALNLKEQEGGVTSATSCNEENRSNLSNQENIKSCDFLSSDLDESHPNGSESLHSRPQKFIFNIQSHRIGPSIGSEAQMRQEDECIEDLNDKLVSESFAHSATDFLSGFNIDHSNARPKNKDISYERFEKEEELNEEFELSQILKPDPKLKSQLVELDTDGKKLQCKIMSKDGSYKVMTLEQTMEEEPEIAKLVEEMISQIIMFHKNMEKVLNPGFNFM